MKYKIIIDKQSRTNPSNERRQYIVECDELRRKNDTCDELSFVEGKVNVIRRIGITKAHETYILDKEQVENYGDMVLYLFEGTNYVYIENQFNNMMTAEYTIENDFTKTYATKLELKASISIESDKIMSIVNKKIGEDNFGTLVEQNVEAIKYAWNQISQFIQMEAIGSDAALSIYNDLKKVLMSLSKLGLKLYDNGKLTTLYNENGQHFFNNSYGQNAEDEQEAIAHIGMLESFESENNSNKGLGFIFNNDIDGFMGWFVRDISIDGSFDIPIMFIGRPKGMHVDNPNAMNLNTDLQMRYNKIYFGYNTNFSCFVFQDYDDNFITQFKNTYSLREESGKNVLHVYGNRGQIYTFDFYYNDLSNINTITCKNLLAENVATCHQVDFFSGNYAGTPSLNVQFGSNQFNLYATTSDRRKKKNIKNSNINATDRIMQIKHREFDWKETNKHEEVGYIAQELEEIDKNYVFNDNDNYQVDTLSILATLTKAFQEQQEQIESLKKEVKELKEEKRCNGKTQS